MTIVIKYCIQYFNDIYRKNSCNDFIRKSNRNVFADDIIICIVGIHISFNNVRIAAII
jgi:hypothetical protein